MGLLLTILYPDGRTNTSFSSPVRLLSVMRMSMSVSGSLRPSSSVRKQRERDPKRSENARGALSATHPKGGCGRKSTSKMGARFFSQKFTCRQSPCARGRILVLGRASRGSSQSSRLETHFYSNCDSPRGTTGTEECERGVDIGYCYREDQA